MLIAAAVWALLNFVLGVAIHYGNNMYPALRDGDLIVAYRLQRPYLNAAVLYERGGEQSLARVIAMPGDVVEISETGALSVNGIAPAEEVFYPTYPAETGNVSYPPHSGRGPGLPAERLPHRPARQPQLWPVGPGGPDRPGPADHAQTGLLKRHAKRRSRRGAPPNPAPTSEHLPATAKTKAVIARRRSRRGHPPRSRTHVRHGNSPPRQRDRQAPDRRRKPLTGGLPQPVCGLVSQ
ncbi:MAG: S26 family signal peptidase [Oscillospiraceae bacterium]|nr:S26 family signal peptidase [Oscillospiraceae bacterium]